MFTDSILTFSNDTFDFLLPDSPENYFPFLSSSNDDSHVLSPTKNRDTATKRLSRDFLSTQSGLSPKRLQRTTRQEESNTVSTISSVASPRLNPLFVQPSASQPSPSLEDQVATLQARVSQLMTQQESSEIRWRESTINYFGFPIIFKEKIKGSNGTSKKGHLYDPATNCRIYKGETIEGIPHGIGSWNGPRDLYQGQFINGRPDGYGFHTNSEGYYFGFFQQSRRHGEGTLMHHNGSVFTGTWENHHFSEGTFNDGKGNIYMGKFINGLLEGFGVLHDQTGLTYQGNFVAGKRHGKGKLSTSDGRTVYKGQWENDHLSGYGVFKDLTKGDVYRGNFLNGKPHGLGDWTYSDGGRYVGMFSSGFYHGTGTKMDPDGTEHSGSFVYGELSANQVSRQQRPLLPKDA